jgi:hypothetical protein
VKRQPELELKGWKAIADFLGQPLAVLHRWSKEGMPVRREGRYTVASRDELRQWLGRESGMKSPAFINEHDNQALASELKKSVREARSHRDRRT